MASFQGNVTGGTLALRANTSTGSTRLVTIPNNAALTVSTIAGNNQWFATSYSGYSGYVVAEFIAITNDGGTCVVTTESDDLNVRDVPSGDVIFTAAKGSTLRLLDSESVSGWFRVSNASGTGWASSSYLAIGIGPGDSDEPSNYPYYVTVDTDKNGDGGRLNMRSAPQSGAEIVTHIPDGENIYVGSLIGTWLPAQYNGYTGYVMGRYIVEADEYSNDSGDDTPPQTTGNLTHGKISNNDWVNIRASASSNGEIVGRLFEGDPLDYYTDEIYTENGVEWYRIKFAGSAYIQARYVAAETYNRTVVATYSYNADTAVSYAANHTVDGKPCNNYNHTFDMGDNDCANFVSQCLCAGGLPMFDGWAYPAVSAVPASWNNSNNWNYTNRTRCALLAKDRIYSIAPTQVQKGDIIFSFDDTESIHEQHYHVVIAATDYDPSTKSCKIHGHTTNQHYEDKELSTDTCRCYRVRPTIKREAYEVRLSLPTTGDGAEVY